MKTKNFARMARACRVAATLGFAGAVLATGCAKRIARHALGAAAHAAEQESDGDDMSPNERKFQAAGKPFVDAVAARNLEAAYTELSSHARKRMNEDQFGGGSDDKNSPGIAHDDVSAAQFAKLFERVEKKFGRPMRLGELSVTETDPNMLAGKAKDNLERFSVAIAIGAMPADIPTGIRKAALRAQIQTIDPNLKRPKRKDGEDDEDIDEHPYFNVKFVLVEEGGKLKVGYFEFFPPSMLD